MHTKTHEDQRLQVLENGISSSTVRAVISLLSHITERFDMYRSSPMYSSGLGGYSGISIINQWALE